MAYLRTDNTRELSSKAKINSFKAVASMARDIHRKSTPKTPKKNGDLRKLVKVQSLGKRASIKWLAKYAAAQEKGVITIKKPGGAVPPGTYVFRKYTTPGTGKHFAQNAVKSVAKNYRGYFRRAGL